MALNKTFTLRFADEHTLKPGSCSAVLSTGRKRQMSNEEEGRYSLYHLHDLSETQRYHPRQTEEETQGKVITNG